MHCTDPDSYGLDLRWERLTDATALDGDGFLTSFLSPHWL